MSTPDAILDGIERREAKLTRVTALATGLGIADQTRDDTEHQGAVLAAAREELADAVEQQERHRANPVGECPWCKGLIHPCPDAEQAARTIARFTGLYA